MRELNPVGREENSLLLVSADGERFTVQVDDTLMRTLKEHKVPDSSGQALSPREIQDAIRQGETIAQLAERSGTSLNLIERFAHPVLEELNHIVDLAKSVRVELPADRFNDVAKREFGLVVEDKLTAAGAENFVWTSRRTENSIWEVSIEFVLGGNAGSATWTFDPRRYLLTPETATAQNLSNPTQVFDSPLGTLNKPAPALHAPVTPAVSETVVTEDKLQAFRSRRERIEVAVVPEPEPAPEPVPAPVVEVIPEPEAEPEPELEPEAIAEVITITQVIEEIPQDLGEETQVEPEPAPNAAKKSRAPMPSWDQIVRGTQTDDSEAF